MVPVALFGWPIVVMALFTLLEVRRAVIVAFLGAWLFLPMAGYPIAGLPDYDKTFAGCAGAMLGILLFDSNRLLAFRPAWIDVPAIVWCLCPLVACLSNGLGLKASLSAFLGQSVMWGMPYLAGRLYFRTPAELRELAIALFIGGLIYVPLCLYEIRMSPQLHTMLYGFHQHSFAQTRRLGGWRPTVFMQHGLAVGMWMCMCAMLGVWLWLSGAVRSLRGVTISVPAVLLGVTAVLCKSLGALQLMILGMAILLIVKMTNRSFVIAVLASIPLLYMGTRVTGLWSGRELLSIQTQLSEQDRVVSLEVRLNNEDRIIGRSWSRPLFGYGWGQFLCSDTGTKDVIPDGLWTLILGKDGMVGLATLSMMLVLPVFVMWRNTPASYWWHPATAPAAGLAVLLCLHLADDLFNAMVNPVFVLAAGALSTLAMALGTQPLSPVVRSSPIWRGRPVPASRPAWRNQPR